MGIFFQNNEDYYTNIDMAKFVDFDDANSGRPSFITSYFISQIRQIKNYRVGTISNELIDSPDFVSFQAYNGEHMYWWIIMIYNNFIDFNELTFGKEVKIPMLSDINKILSGMQLAQTNYENGNVEGITLVK